MRTKLKSLFVIALTIFSLNATTVPTSALDLGAKGTYIITISPAARAAIESSITKNGWNVKNKYQYAFDGFTVELPKIAATLLSRIPNVLSIEEDQPLGTAGCVKNIAELLDETFLVISGDSITDFDLSAAIEFHKQKQSKATLILTRVPNPIEFGVVITDTQGRINRFLEKPSTSEIFSDTVNTGIYILNSLKRQHTFFEKLLSNSKMCYFHVCHINKFYFKIGACCLCVCADIEEVTARG